MTMSDAESKLAIKEESSKEESSTVDEGGKAPHCAKEVKEYLRVEAQFVSGDVFTFEVPLGEIASGTPASETKNVTSKTSRANSTDIASIRKKIATHTGKDLNCIRVRALAEVDRPVGDDSVVEVVVPEEINKGQENDTSSEAEDVDMDGTRIIELDSSWCCTEINPDQSGEEWEVKHHALTCWGDEWDGELQKTPNKTLRPDEKSVLISVPRLCVPIPAFVPETEASIIVAQEGIVHEMENKLNVMDAKEAPPSWEDIGDLSSHDESPSLKGSPPLTEEPHSAKHVHHVVVAVLKLYVFIVMPHVLHHGQCMICVACKHCTGYGESCVTEVLRKNRQEEPEENGLAKGKGKPGGHCGCGSGASGCKFCTRCEACCLLCDGCPGERGEDDDVASKSLTEQPEEGPSAANPFTWSPDAPAFPSRPGLGEGAVRVREARRIPEDREAQIFSSETSHFLQSITSLVRKQNPAVLQEVLESNVSGMSLGNIIETGFPGVPALDIAFASEQRDADQRHLF